MEKERYDTFDFEDNRRVVEALRSGDEHCFDALFRRCYRPLCAYASRFVPLSRAEELVQDTLLWLWENRRTLIPEMPLRSLLFTIVRNKSLNSASRNSLRNRILRELASDFEEEFDDPALYFESELARRFAEALRRLPEEFQQTFRMHRLEGKTHRQIAEELHVSPQTVNYRIGQTVRLLRDEAEVVDGEAHGRITITGDEFFVQGHFPGNPVVPGVILCEIMAQSCALLVGAEAVGKTPMYTGLDKVKFRNPVRPGDTVEVTASLERRMGNFFFAKAEARVGDKMCVQGHLSFAMVEG